MKEFLSLIEAEICDFFKDIIDKGEEAASRRSRRSFIIQLLTLGFLIFAYFSLFNRVDYRYHNTRRSLQDVNQVQISPYNGHQIGKIQVSPQTINFNDLGFN